MLHVLYLAQSALRQNAFCEYIGHFFDCNAFTGRNVHGRSYTTICALPEALRDLVRRVNPKLLRQDIRFNTVRQIGSFPTHVDGQVKQICSEIYAGTNATRLAV